MNINNWGNDEKKDDETVYEPDSTVYESDKTVYESDETVYESDETVYEGAESVIKPEETISFNPGALLLGTYMIEADAIHGGMGAVWRVHHLNWDVDLAMKRPLDKLFNNEEQKKGFIHECEAWINLGLHPNIVACYYVREIGGVPTIFSEWMENGSLENRIKDGTLYDGTEEEVQARLLDIAIQFARGLHYAHEHQGMIHQDVKPDNLLLTNKWEAKVSDFGLARARTQTSELSMAAANADPGATVVAPTGGYTPAYCSSEQMEGKPLTRRTDIYSWAVSIMEMYIGSRPWINGIVAGVNNQEYLETARFPVPGELKGVLSRCLKENPEERPHDFAEIEEELKRIYKNVTGQAYSRQEPLVLTATAGSLNNKALSFLDLGKIEEAEALLEEAFTKKSDDEAIRINKALLSWRRGKIDDVYMKILLSDLMDDPTVSNSLDQECPIVTEMDVREFGHGVPKAIVSKDGNMAVVQGYHLGPQVVDTLTLWHRYAMDIRGMECYGVTFSLDSRFIYVYCEGGNERAFFIFDAATGTRLLEKSCAAEPSTGSIGMRPSPDGKSIVCFTGGFDNTFIIRDAQTLEVISRHKFGQMDERGVRCEFELLPNGREVIVRTPVDARRISLETYEVMNIYQVEYPPRSVKETGEFYRSLDALIVDPSGRYMLTADKDCLISLWDIETGKRLKDLYKNRVRFAALTFMEGGKRFVSADEDGVVRFHDFPGGGHVTNHSIVSDKLRHTFKLGAILLRTSDPYTVVLIDNSTNLLTIEATDVGKAMPMRLSQIMGFEQTASDEEEYHLAIEQAREALGKRQISVALDALNKAYSCKFRDAEELSELNREIGRFCNKKKLRSFQYIKSEHVSERLMGSYGTPVDVAIPKDGSYVYMTGKLGKTGIHRINIETLEIEEFCKNRLNYGDSSCTHFSPDGRYMTLIRDGGLEIFDMNESDEDIESDVCFYVKEYVVKDGCCDNEGNVIFVSSEGVDYYTHKSKYKKGFNLREVKTSKPYERCCCFSSDGRFVYLLQTGSLMEYQIDKHGASREIVHDYFDSMDLSQDGSLIAVGMDRPGIESGDAHVFRVSDSEEIFKMEVTGKGLKSVAFGPDGDKLYCGITDGSIEVYDLNTSEHIGTLSRGEKENYIRSIAVSKGDRYVFAGEKSGYVSIYELEWEYSL